MWFESGIGEVLIIFLVITTLTPTVFSCSCLPSHPQEHYCKSDFVLLVKVKGRKVGAYEAVYQVKVKKAFKMSDKVNATLKGGQIWTASDEGRCGVHLKTNTKYLITGHLGGGKAWTSLCNYHEDWTKLTVKQRKGFRLLYKHGCECKTCIGKQCTINANTCHLDFIRDPRGSCQSQHSICTPHPNGHCQWSKNRAYRECVKEKQKRDRMEP